MLTALASIIHVTAFLQTSLFELFWKQKMRKLRGDLSTKISRKHLCGGGELGGIGEGVVGTASQERGAR